ncbi:MAG: hypothetical protein FWC70_11050 [Defluviitaleaceae bacterium]|nr:hypothetical protein [Defluviitaleaceae bacterium]
MLAVQGFFNNGLFTPIESISLPRQGRAVLVIETSPPNDDDQANFWEEFDRLVDSAVNEPLPDFPRMRFGRDVVTFAED